MKTIYNQKTRFSALSVIFFLQLTFFPAASLFAQDQRPNVIFILGDDIGYDVPGINGGQSYSTPNIDSMGRHGMNFTHCESTPLCSPSRCVLLTGKFNFRNYSNWGYMSYDEKTFGNMMHDAGYATGFFGKLQLKIEDSSTMNNWGFDRYSVFEISEDTLPEHRYKNPRLLTNEGYMPDSVTVNKYSEDLITQEIFDFIDSNQSHPFFVYYPMSLAHTPFSPTPDDTAFASWNPDANRADTSFFPSMIKYMDKKIGMILDKLRTVGLDQNTIVIYSGDNGTPPQIIYLANDAEVVGGKNSSTEAGTHVPLVAYWPGHIPEGTQSDDLIDFTDFFPTFAQAAGVSDLSNYGIMDGLSFYSRMLGINDTAKKQLFNHYDANPGQTDKSLKRWVRDKTYKLYDTTGPKLSNKFFNIVTDPNELSPLNDTLLTVDEIAIRQNFRLILDTTGTWPTRPQITSSIASGITNNSAILSATILSEGASALLDRGSTCDIKGETLPLLRVNRQRDTTAAPGIFSQIRSGLNPQSQYTGGMYAMNSNKSNSTSFAFTDFYTLSNPPLQQPASFTATTDNCITTLTWTSATFPTTGASKAGYLLVYSTGNPGLIKNFNGKTPAKAVARGVIVPLNTTSLPAQPAKSIQLYNLSKDSIYHFLLIPYTWNGKSDLTYDYLAAGALATTPVKIASKFVLNTSITKPLCFGGADGNISANASRGFPPYLYNINAGMYDTVHVFPNLTAGSYVLASKDSKGCVTTKTVSVAQPSQVLFSVKNQKTSCIGAADGSITITARGGLKPYLYSFNGGPFDTVSKFTNLAAGDYTVAVQDRYKCTTPIEVIGLTDPANACGSGFVTSIGNDRVSKNEMNESAAITIAPNPSKSEFRLYANINGQALITVYDAYGKQLYQTTCKNGRGCTFGSTFIPGVYFVNISGQTRTILKIIKE